MRISAVLVPTALAFALAACNQSAQTVDAKPLPQATATAVAMTDAQLLERGEYLVRIAGCNDCHTPGYAENAGKVPKSQWLVGTTIGWKGPWGTTYPANLRLKVADMDDAKWLEYSRTLHTRPPMPDFAVRDMTEADRLALFRLLKSLGPTGEPAPAFLEPGQQPPVPFVEFNLPPPPPAAATQAEPPAAG